MRLAAALALLAALALAAPASAGTPAGTPAGADRASYYRGECRKLEKQIRHFEGVARSADAQGDELREAHTRSHIRRLAAQRRERCGADTQDDGFAAAFWRATRAAGRTAVRAFTFGAY